MNTFVYTTTVALVLLWMFKDSIWKEIFGDNYHLPYSFRPRFMLALLTLALTVGLAASVSFGFRVSR